MIQIDLNNPVALEEQIAAALRQALARREIRPGDELPSVRQLAGDLGVHWNTVARAYRRLADEALLIVRRGKSVVAQDPTPLPSKVSRARMHDRFAEAISTALLGGVSHKDIAGVFRETLAEFQEQTKS